MDRITITIPTRNRLERLKQSLASILDVPWVEVIVALDGPPDAAEALEISRGPGRRPDMVIWSKENRGVVATMNLLTPMVGDGLIYSGDDIEFMPGVIEKAREIFNREFPDDDGVLGFHQEGLPSYCPTGNCLIGQKFLQRLPGKQVFYPGYYHFCGDVEIYRLAAKLDKFRFGGKELAVIHHQAGYEGRPLDQTHHDSRIKQRADSDLRAERERTGQIWGDPEAKGIEKPPLDRAIKPEEVEKK